MKVVAFNGSARKDGNTAILVNALFKELKKEGIRTETRASSQDRRSTGALHAGSVLRRKTGGAR